MELSSALIIIVVVLFLIIFFLSLSFMLYFGFAIRNQCKRNFSLCVPKRQRCNNQIPIPELPSEPLSALNTSEPSTALQTSAKCPQTTIVTDSIMVIDGSASKLERSYGSTIPAHLNSLDLTNSIAADVGVLSTKVPSDVDNHQLADDLSTCPPSCGSPFLGTGYKFEPKARHSVSSSDLQVGYHSPLNIPSPSVSEIVLQENSISRDNKTLYPAPEIYSVEPLIYEFENHSYDVPVGMRHIVKWGSKVKEKLKNTYDLS